MSTSFTMLKPLADGWCHGIYPFKIMPCLLLFPFQISAVRAVVPNKSNNEIVLVLQHFENCVDKAVHAFLEGMNGTTICATILWPVVIVGQMSLGCILLTWNVPTTLQSWCRGLYIYIYKIYIKHRMFLHKDDIRPGIYEPHLNYLICLYIFWFYSAQTCEMFDWRCYQLLKYLLMTPNMHPLFRKHGGLSVGISRHLCHTACIVVPTIVYCYL